MRSGDLLLDVKTAERKAVFLPEKKKLDEVRARSENTLQTSLGCYVHVTGRKFVLHVCASVLLNRTFFLTSASGTLKKFERILPSIDFNYFPFMTNVYSWG